MRKLRKNDPMQKFEAEHAKSEQIVKKLQSVAKQNKARTSKAKLSEHKFEYIKQALTYNTEVYSLLKNYNGRRRLENDLKNFLQEKQPAFGLLALNEELNTKTDLLSKTLLYHLSGLKALQKDCLEMDKKIRSEKSRIKPELKKKYAKKLTDVQEIRSILKSTLDKIAAELEWEYQDLCSEHTASICSQASKRLDTNTRFIDEYRGVIEEEELEEIKRQYVKLIDLHTKMYNIENDQIFNNNPHKLEDFELTETEYDTFKLIHKEYVEGGKPREKYMERLLIAFPLKSRKELEMIDSYIEYERWARKKSDSLRRQVMAKKQELQQKVELMLRTDVENMKVDIEQKLDLLKQEAKLRKIKQLHEENVEKYQDKIAVINALQERKKKEEKEELERKEEEWKEHVEEVKMKAVEFKEEKAKKKWMQEQEVRYRQQMLKEEMKRRIEENKDKVDERNLAEMEKLEKRLVDKANTEREKEEYKEKLNTAIENYKFRPKVEADEKRLEQFTEAMMIRKDTAMDQGDNIKLFKDYGYNTDQLMKDLRFKISTVLAEQGLTNMTYAQQLLKNTASNLPTRLDNASTIKHLS